MKKQFVIIITYIGLNVKIRTARSHTSVHFDSIGERPRTNNHLEDYHRQLNARVRMNPDLWTWINEVRSSEESVMCRYEQKQVQKRTTRSRKIKNIRDDEKLKIAKTKYIQDQDFNAYQKVYSS